MCVCNSDRLPETKYHKQADLENTFFGNNQGETVEFGAEQCMHISSVTVNHVLTSPFRCARAQRCREGKASTKAGEQHHYVGFYVLALAGYLTYAHRTLYESKGLEFNDVGPNFLYF